jgi:hypothetical protein
VHCAPEQTVPPHLAPPQPTASCETSFSARRRVCSRHQPSPECRESCCQCLSRGVQPVLTPASTARPPRRYSRFGGGHGSLLMMTVLAMGARPWPLPPQRDQRDIHSHATLIALFVVHVDACNVDAGLQHVGSDSLTGSQGRSFRTNQTRRSVA